MHRCIRLQRGALLQLQRAEKTGPAKAAAAGEPGESGCAHRIEKPADCPAGTFLASSH